MRKILFLLALLAFAACKGPKVITQVKRVVITEVTSDTVVYSKPDSASIEALIKCDSAGNAYIAEIQQLKAGKYTVPQVRMKDNIVYLDCNVDSAAVYLKMSKQFRSEIDSTHKDVIVYRDKKERFIDRAVDTFWKISLGVLLLGCILLYLKFRK